MPEYGLSLTYIFPYNDSVLIRENETQKTPIFAYFTQSLREKYPNTEFFLVSIFLYSVRKQENTDQKKLRIWIFFTQ